jgi:hypothetical protein
MTDIKRSSAPRDTRPFNRRNLLRQAGFLGAGAVGLSLAGCKQRPDDALADSTTTPQILQQGGTVSVTMSGLLGGAAIPEGTMQVVGVGTASADADGQLSVRVTTTGTYEVVFRAPGHFARSGRVTVAGNVTLAITMLESDDVSQGFLNQYARGTGSGKGIEVEPRTPGFTNRWTQTPTYRIYRKIADSSKEIVPDARVDAMRSAIASLFPALTASRVGFPEIIVRNTAPPTSLGDISSGTMVVAQTKSSAQVAEHTGGLSSPYSIVKGRISCGLDSPIELFNKMVAHSTGAYGVNGGYNSILSGGGRATLGSRDTVAATFLYSRVPGNEAPDRDPDDVLLG